MQNIFSGEILNVTPFNQGFVFAVKEQNAEGKPVARYYGYDVVNRALSRIKKAIYLRIKFGYESEAISEVLPDYVSCDAGFLNDGKTMVIFPNGNYSVFNTNGTESIASQLSYRDCAACDIAVDDEFVWSAVPADNSVIKYSPKDGRIVLRVGGGDETRFDRPTSVSLLGSTLYVCNRASKKIVALDTATNETKDYRVFNEHVIKYINSQSMEYVWLDSGIYVLD